MAYCTVLVYYYNKSQDFAIENFFNINFKVDTKVNLISFGPLNNFTAYKTAFPLLDSYMKVK